LLENAGAFDEDFHHPESQGDDGPGTTAFATLWAENVA
jgi:hypothetical protein